MTLLHSVADLDPEQFAQPAARQRIWAGVALVLAVILSASYFFVAFELAASRPFWMDEVLAVWAARLPTIGAVWDALEKGAEFSPPIYDVFLHELVQFGASDPLLLRLPSIIAVYIVGVAAFIFVRRRHSAPIAVLAMALCLTGGLFPFAIQVRQYACVAACFTLAVILWDTLPREKPSWWAAAALFGLLTVAIGMHFYAALLAAALGLMELIWSVANRRIRWIYIGAVVLACASTLIWIPIIEHIVAFNSGDINASEYYAKPLLSKLPAIYAAILIGHDSPWLSSLAALGVVAVIRFLSMLLGTQTGTTFDPKDINLNIVVAVLCMLPVGIFVFSFLVTHTFNLRYVIAAAFGFSVLIARLLALLPWANAFAFAATMISIVASCTGVSTISFAEPADVAITLVASAPPDLPIVTGNGLRFFEISENSKFSVARRLVYLTTPNGVIHPDPTNEHQVERWKSIAPNLAVIDIDAFLKNHSKFLLFEDQSAFDVVPKLLMRRGYKLRLIAHEQDAFLFEANVGAIESKG